MLSTSLSATVSPRTQMVDCGRAASDIFQTLMELLAPRIIRTLFVISIVPLLVRALVTGTKGTQVPLLAMETVAPVAMTRLVPLGNAFADASTRHHQFRYDSGGPK